MKKILLTSIALLAMMMTFGQNDEAVYACFDKTKEKVGLMDRNGNVIIEPQFSVFTGLLYPNGIGSCFQYGRAVMFVEGEDFLDLRPVFVDKHGKVEEIQTKIDDIGWFSEGMLSVKIGGKYGFRDTSDKLVIQPRFDDCKEFKEGLAPVKMNDKWGFINKSGEMVIEPQFKEANPFSEGLAAVEFVRTDEGSSRGFIDMNGKTIIELEPKFEEVKAFSDGLAAVKIWDDNEGYMGGFIDKNGKLVMNNQYNRVSGFHEGLSIVVVDDKKFGVINKSGEMVIEPQFEDAKSFSEGLAAVCKNGKWGYIDRAGKVIIDFQFKSANDFYNGLGRVESNENDDMFYIDKTGKRVLNAIR